MLKRNKILIVEDDPAACEMMIEFLKDRGFDMTGVETATDAISYVMHHHYDLIILDLNLPDYDGFEILKTIHKWVTTPAIVVSAYNDTPNKLKAFKLGAYDYISKPVDLEELEARIWVQLRNYSPLAQKMETATRKESCFQIVNGTVLMNGEAIPLTGIEFDIFSYLYENRNKIVPRQTLVSILSSQITERSLDNHIKNIRKKIGDDGRKKIYLKTVYGTGYMLKD